MLLAGLGLVETVRLLAEDSEEKEDTFGGNNKNGKKDPWIYGHLDG